MSIAAEQEGSQASAVPGWLVFSVLPVVITLLLAAHGGRIVQVAFTPIALLCGLYLCFRFPRIFVAYVISLACFTPLARRVADSQTAYTGQSLILLGSILVPALAALRLSPSIFLKSRYLCFLLAALAIGYGTAVGIFTGGFGAAIPVAVTWFIPLLFGLYCATYEDADRRLARAFVNTVVVAGFLVAVYGLVQYFSPASWDTDWLTQMQAEGLARSMGTAEPLGIRVFSTMNSPSIAAALLGSALLAATQIKTRWRFVAIVVIVSTLGLTIVRSEWVACFVGVCILLLRASSKARFQALLAFCLAIPLMVAFGDTPAGERINSRLATFGSVKEDTSYKERKLGITNAANVVLSRPFGMGVGYAGTPQASHVAFAPADIGFLDVPMQLGYLGCILYVSALLLLLVSIFRGGLTRKGEALALAVITAHIFVLFADENPLLGTVGLLLWAPVGLLTGITPAPEGTLAASPMLRASHSYQPS